MSRFRDLSSSSGNYAAITDSISDGRHRLSSIRKLILALYYPLLCRVKAPASPRAEVMHEEDISGRRRCLAALLESLACCRCSSREIVSRILG